MTKLGAGTLGDLTPATARPGYDRDAVQVGVVHFGPGAFHRGHQAVYFDQLLETDPRWGIAAVSLRSRPTVEGLAAQDGLYTLAVLDAEPSFRVIGSHKVFLGPGDEAEVRRLLASESVAIVSSTVTEKGYCLAGDGSLDFAHPDIVHDLGTPEAPVSLVGWITLGLRDRRAARLPAFTVLCCDNMVSNGHKLGAAVRAYAERIDPELAAWIAADVRFPNTMVDSITPATDDKVRATVAGAIGVDDAIPISREAYTAWIVEDVLPDGAPDLASVGVVLAADVAVYELAKLRVLNGAHSTLAYAGLMMGHETVADAMGDPVLSAFVRRMMMEDIVPSLPAASGVDFAAYAEEILQRFENPAIGHKLAQIAWDGSQKLPYRILDTVQDALANGRSVERLAVPVAAWMLFVQRQAKAGVDIVDPLADMLAEIGGTSASEGELAERLLALRQIFPQSLAQDAGFRTALLDTLSNLQADGFAATLGTR